MNTSTQSFTGGQQNLNYPLSDSENDRPPVFNVH